ncbi:polymorphic toxin-type HINT domain-containing protein [Paenibacillus antri]|nr:polymorphic toxin-type HINT domain-containing protein [Paenibacillus antri]
MDKDTYEGDITNPLTLNLYTYVANNPLRYVDPSGHCFTEALGQSYCEAALEWENEKIGFIQPLVNTIDYMPGGTGVRAVKAAPTVIKKAPAFLEKVTDAFKKVVDDVKKAVIGCNCFTAGTKVLTDEGEKNIEDIEVGDMVLAKNEETGEQAYKEVTHLYRNDKEIIYELTVGDQVIETTDNHPFWVEGKGWVLAADLQVGDKLQQSNGNTLTIDSIKIVKHDEKVKVYNFTVADFHTYFVSDLGIWVHNIDCLDGKHYLNEALKQQNLTSVPANGLKQKWSQDGYDFEVRVHAADPNYGKTGDIYRVARRQQGTNANGQGYGWEYIDHNGVWHHTSTLKPSSPNYNAQAAADTHIQLP